MCIPDRQTIEAQHGVTITLHRPAGFSVSNNIVACVVADAEPRSDRGSCGRPATATVEACSSLPDPS